MVKDVMIGCLKHKILDIQDQLKYYREQQYQPYQRELNELYKRTISSLEELQGVYEEELEELEQNV